ncbi:MAG: FtsX-like permease family protein [Cyclobacteriaceae bacterium]
MSAPPKILLRLLQLCAPLSKLDDIEGDTLELYQERLEEKGSSKAKILLLTDCLSLLRLKILTTTTTSGTHIMIGNYIKTSSRALLKNPVTSAISIFGLALAIGCAITTYVWMDFQLHLDSFHPHLNNTYQVVSKVVEKDELVLHGPSPLPLSQSLLADQPEVRFAVRMQYEQANVRFDRNVFQERVLFADPSFMYAFEFPIRYGNRSALETRGNIMISEDVATKYFGEYNPMGKEMKLQFAQGAKQTFVVAGVFEERPSNASFGPSILLPLEHYFDIEDQRENDWSAFNSATFVVLDESSLTALDERLASYAEIQNAANGDLKVDGFELIRLPELSHRAWEIHQSVAHGNSLDGVYGMPFIGTLLLIMACFNYVNVAVSTATRRLKEIAIRKVMGSARQGIIILFLIENLLVSLFSILLGVALCYYFFQPGFSAMAGIEIPFAFSSPLVALYFFLAIFLLTGIFSGAYPALYISKFQPNAIIKGSLKFGNSNLFSKVLLTLQLFIAFTSIIGSLIFTDNAMFIKELDWGYEPNNVLAIKVNDQKQYDLLRETALTNNSVIAAVGASGHVGVDNRFTVVSQLEDQIKTLAYDVSPGYLETLEIPLLEGRYFEENKSLQESRSMIVNRAFSDRMGWDSPIGKTLTFDGVDRTVVGLTDNFHHTFFGYDEIRPMIFIANETPQYDYLVLKTEQGNTVMVDGAMQEAFHQIAPDDPYSKYYQDEIFNRAYHNVDTNIALMITIAIISIILSCLGLYGLLSFSIQKRFKEFGIRKALGAEWQHIVKTIAKQYAPIILVSFVIGVPIATYFINGTGHSMFSITKPLNPLTVLLALAIIISSLGITVFSQIYKATRVNPSDVLKSE